MNDSYSSSDIAIIGMSGRFPGANNLEEFWQNLCEGKESTRALSVQELKELDIDESLIQSPNYIKVTSALESMDKFDAQFFGYSPREAELMDPQHRLFLECCWEALEYSGHAGKTIENSVGVFAGATTNTYLLYNLLSNHNILEAYDPIQIDIGNGADFLSTRVSYKLNLTGPSLTVQTACSTSLVAVHLACQSLLLEECDMALAGGVSINVKHAEGYFFLDGGILSKDGHTRVFDSKGSGTVFGSGVGVIVLKRLTDALKDGDSILAIIKGSAINNDGASKVGYTAPSVDGQANVILQTLAVADISAETISYVEAHGTATKIGDPIEIRALSKAFQAETHKKGFCAIGSVKANIGHLAGAAGIAGLIKVVLSLKNKLIPPNLFFEEPNPEIDFSNSPFFVNTKLASWTSGVHPRRAAVSSFGMGGTNAHVILEEAPVNDSMSRSNKSHHLVLLSTKTNSALEAATYNLSDYLRKNSTLILADVSYTLQVGREAFDHRRMAVVSSDSMAAASILQTGDSDQVFSNRVDGFSRPVAFVFPGQGVQHREMCKELYESEKFFKHQVENCLEILNSHINFDLREIIFPKHDQNNSTTDDLRQTAIAQPALFVIEYALAKLWQSWGVEPSVMLGHSLGEYVAACLSGVFSLEDALMLVASRGRLMQELPSGSMLAVRLPEDHLELLLEDDIEIAAINSPTQSVVSGPSKSIQDFKRKLDAINIPYNQLDTSHAFHSWIMSPAAKSFAEIVRKVKLYPPKLPFISCVTGNWIRPDEATNPDYWATQLRQTVHFSRGVSTLNQNSEHIFLEIGPGQTLSTLIEQNQGANPNIVLSTLPSKAHTNSSEWEFLLRTIGKLWLLGVDVDWHRFYSNEKRQRIPLPTYPFERKRYWIMPSEGRVNEVAQARTRTKDLAEHYYFQSMNTSSGSTHDQSLYENPIQDPAPVYPQNELERTVVDIYQTVLGIKDISIRDNFFKLGGDSLLAIQVITRLNKAIGMELDVKAFFEHPTVEKITEYITASQKIKHTNSIALISREGNVPLSFAQERLWFLYQLEPQNSTYNISFAIKIIGSLDTAILQQCLSEIIARHEVLRTHFVSIDGIPYQSISPIKLYNLFITDLRKMEESKREEMALQLLRESMQGPFSLSEESLIRCYLLELGNSSFILQVNMHHIIADGWSIGVFLKELKKLYEAFVNGYSSPLPPLPFQYADYAYWQRQWLQSELAENSLLYWKRQLVDAEVLQLATDHPYPAVQTFRGARKSFTVSRDTTRLLETIGQDEQVTLFMTLLATFRLLLFRYSGQEDICIGTPIANRNMTEIEEMIGMFVNTVVIRTDLSKDPMFRDLLIRERQSVLDAFPNSEYPFERLVMELHPERNLNTNPIFQVMFTLQNVPMPSYDIADFEISQLDIDSETARFDLSLEVIKTDSGLRGWLEYNTDLFESETMDRMVQHFYTLLEAVANNPDAHLSQLSVMPEAEMQRVLVEWNQTEAEYRREACLHTFFEEQVHHTPTRIAAVYEEEQLTYAELNARANQLARYLRDLGVGPESLVGICQDRSLKMLVSTLAVLKAGGAYVPLDPSYPLDRLAFMVKDSRLSILLTCQEQEQICQQLSEKQPEIKIITLDTDWEVISQKSSENLTLETTSENLAYVIYTSGSTGRPKGVQISHSALVNLLSAMRKQPGLTAEDILVAVTTLSFDIASLELYLPLLTGAQLVIASREAAMDGKLLLDLLLESEATVMQATPITWRLLLDAGWQGKENFKTLCGGEALPRELANELLQKQIQLWNMYGPTETTIWSTLCQIQPNDTDISIGRPIANTQCYVLDAHLQPVPIGVPGELYIGGDGLARGYLNRPELTAEKFIPNPFSNTPGARLYETGDMAKYKPDGQLLYLGRSDNQVKFRGFRIELGEIEANILQYPGVKTAVVLIKELAGNQQLLAYYVADEEVDHEQLHHFLKTQLPAYMLPALFQKLESFPHTPNGKLDYRALPEIQEWRARPPREYAPPRNLLESTLAEIWCSCLGLDRVGIHADFFHLGGHSLLATQLVSRINQFLAIDIPLRIIFEYPTIATLAQQIELARKANKDMGHLPKINQAKKDRAVPLSFSQERLWFLDTLNPGNAFYNIPISIKVLGPLDVSILERSLNEIVRRHEVLRSIYSNVEGIPVMTTYPAVNISLPVKNLTYFSKEDRELEAVRLSTENAQNSFDLEKGPLLRGSILQMGGEEYIVNLTVHHIVFDGWSIGILLREVATLYEAYLNGKPSPLADLSIQYADYAYWQREQMKSEVMKKQLDYWRKQLTAAPTILDLPTSKPRSNLQSFKGATKVFLLPDATYHSVIRFSHNEKLSTFMTFLAVFEVLLYRFTGTNDISIGSPVANRNRIETEDLIGFFINPLILRTDLSGNPTFLELLKRVKKITLEAFDHQDIPFSTIIAEVQPERALNYQPLFNIAFVLFNVPLPPLKIANLRLVPSIVYRGAAIHDLILTLIELEGKLVAQWEYNSDLLDETMIIHLQEYYEFLLSNVETNAQKPISEIELFSNEVGQMLNTFKTDDGEE